jgi:(2Fe-2S) ferredoxin
MQEIEDRDVTSNCLVTNTGCWGIYGKVPVAVVYRKGTAFPSIHTKSRQDFLDSHYGQDSIVC